MANKRIKLSSDGRIVIPAGFRAQDNLRAGQQFEVERVQCGEYRLKRIANGRRRSGLVDWLLACPVKGRFEPVPSELTNQIH
jgi:AbrB family looped-hinge helix DNA binding protein